MRRLAHTVALSVWLAVAAPAANGAGPGEFIGAWTTECASGAPCEAATGESVRLVVEPGGTGWFVAVEYDGAIADPERPFKLSFPDGPEIIALPKAAMRPFRSAARFYFTDTSVLERLFPALVSREHATLSFIDVTGEPVAVRFELSGLATALHWLDGAQGTTPRPRIAAAAEGLPRPELRSRAEAIRAAGIPDPVFYLHMGRSDCEDPQSSRLSDIGAIIEPVSETAILYAIPCTVGGDNVTFRLYVRESGEIGGVHTLFFALWSQEYGWSGTDLLYNVEAVGPRLVATFRGRGATDCGWQARWTFVDYAYRLERFAVQEACGGADPPDWPPIYGPVN